MLDNDEKNIERWSFYDEYLKSNKVKLTRQKYPSIDEVVVNKIKNREIPKAADLRDKLKVILSAKPSTINKFVNGEKTFSQCYESACDQGANESCCNKLNKFRKWLVEPETEANILQLNDELKNKCIFELVKIHDYLENKLMKNLTVKK